MEILSAILCCWHDPGGRCSPESVLVQWFNINQVFQCNRKWGVSMSTGFWVGEKVWWCPRFYKEFCLNHPQQWVEYPQLSFSLYYFLLLFRSPFVKMVRYQLIFTNPESSKAIKFKKYRYSENVYPLNCYSLMWIRLFVSSNITKRWVALSNICL